MIITYEKTKARKLKVASTFTVFVGRGGGAGGAVATTGPYIPVYRRRKRP
jgi:hypothetical protein